MTDVPPLRRRTRTRTAGEGPNDAATEASSEPVAPPGDPGPPSTPLTAPAEGTPVPATTSAQLAEIIDRFKGGVGPVALDAERASGYRYSQRAYLVQLRRRGSGTALIDPVPLPDLSSLDEVLADTEWVLHAASQDLACLAEVGLRPRKLFDTELAARLAGFERVGLAALTEQLLGRSLEKHHSAADWSSRPLPESWLTYAALDVELLVELRDLLVEELAKQGKTEWAAQEFAALVVGGGQPAKVRVDPWRRTSGMHRVRGARAQSRVRALWYARDTIASRRDTAPGRVLPDTAIVAAAEMDPKDERELLLLPGFGGRSIRRLAQTWLDALAEARELPDSALPTTPSFDGPPPPHRWSEKDPVAAERLGRCRAVVMSIATELNVPPENLITPETVRRLAWEPPDPIDVTTITAELARYGARRWQIDLLATELAGALPN
ncbi:ribonuclease D [Allocatelliglobosispora scoriae]|uniref:Ribonuclease D n=1 Tax=Allocatelliglobosispora scoriae TaxID=643052 RepID=A0A841BTL9_9ACTN|nr:ribonuclease D [Allocatelliglobosispora scoriae]MBB5872427.1 ribonuclease D [Allocatelliglobosispora scoriae]